MKRILGQPLLWLVVQAVLLVAALWSAGRLRPLIHPDTATYEHVDWSSMSAIWSGIRTPGYPLFIDTAAFCAPRHGAVPILQVVCHILGAWTLYFGLRAAGYRGWAALLCASTFYYRDDLLRFTPDVLSDSLAASLALMAVGCFLAANSGDGKWYRWLLLVLLTLAAPLWSQGATALYSRWNALSGFEFQRYGFSQGLGVKSASQWSLPLVVVAPLGRRMSLDLTTHLAHSAITDSAGSSADFTGLTDTQLRLLYTVGRDRAVASLSVNLPTGKHSLTTTQFGVSSAVSSNFLSFPVSNLGTSFGITGGLAYAVPAGGWNVGLAGSVRYQSSYKPLSDSGATLSYNPGIESRLRIGADRVIDYHHQDFTRSGERYDIIFDAVSSRSFGECRRVLSSRGVYINTLPSFSIFRNILLTSLVPGKKATTIMVGFKAADMAWLCGQIEAGRIKVVLDRVLPLDRVKDALAYSQAGRARGKVVLKVS